MKIRTAKAIPGLVIFVLAVSAQAAPAGRQEDSEQAVFETVRDFYRYHFTHDMAFMTRNIKERSRWFHPAFLKMLLDDREMTGIWQKAHPDMVPKIDGDPFTDSQEYPNACDAQTLWILALKAEVRIKLLWLDKDKKPLRERLISVLLEKDGGRWWISDFISEHGQSLRAELAVKT